jgi:hypothetical protein
MHEQRGAAPHGAHSSTSVAPPTSSLSPFPSLPLRRAPMAAFHELKSDHGCPPKESLTQALYSSRDNQNGCT